MSRRKGEAGVGESPHVQRSGPRSWPPKPHKDPIAFNAGQEATGLLKAISVKLLPYYQTLLDRRDGVWTCDQVREFDLSFYVPLDILDRRTARIHNIVIMVNGLNEIRHVHYRHYDRIGARLASRGIGAILSPTPFHLNRAAYIERRYERQYKRHHRQTGCEPLQVWGRDPKAVSTRVPHHSLLKKPEAIFYCFEQTANELKVLAELLTGSSTPASAERSFFERLFSLEPTTRVSLLGYSLGGLQALYAFLLKPELFHRCILINSGARLHDIKTKPVLINDRDWHTILDEVSTVRVENREGIEHPSILDDVLFNRPFSEPQARENFRQNVHKILFVSGGADIVSPAEHLSRFLRPEDAPESGLNILLLGGVAHTLEHSPAYDEWFLALMRIVEQFVRAPSDETPVPYDRLIQDLASIRVGKKSWAVHVRDHDSSTPEDAFVNPNDQSIDLQRLLDLLSDDDQAKFLDYYYISKRFFDNDGDMIREVDRSQRDTRRGQRQTPK